MIGKRPGQPLRHRTEHFDPGGAARSNTPTAITVAPTTAISTTGMRLGQGLNASSTTSVPAPSTIAAGLAAPVDDRAPDRPQSRSGPLLSI